MRVIVYARVSTAKQDLNRQIRLAEEYCAPRKYLIVDTIVEKMSGTKSEAERSGLKRLMSLTKDECDLVVVSELSRISREEEFQRIFSRIDTLRDNGISVVFLDDPDNIYSKDNPITFVQFIMLGVRAQGAREELLKIRDRMKTGMRSKLALNPYMVTTSKVPFGFASYRNPDYIQGKTPKTLMRIDPESSAILRRCYDMAITGSSCQSIADFLNRSGYCSQSGKQWRANVVLEMLKNRLYIGERTISGITHHIEPIIPIEVYEQTLKNLSSNRCMISRNEERYNPLKGLLYCACGLKMMLIRWHNQLVYRCLYHSYKNRGNKEYKPCHNSLVHYDILVNTVWTATVDRLKSDEYYGRSLQTVADYEKQMSAIEKTMARYIKERKPLTADLNKRKRQLEAVSDADLIELIESSYKEIKAKIEALNDKIKACQKEHNKLNISKSELQSEINLNDDMTIFEKAEFFHRTLSRITFDGKHYKRRGTLTLDFINGDTLTMEIPTK